MRYFAPLRHLRAIVLILLCLFSFSFFACKKKGEEKAAVQNSTKFIAEKTTVKTFEIIQLNTKASIASKYTGQFGSRPVTINRITDSTLGFMVPDVAAGNYVLTFDSETIKFTVTKTPEVNAGQMADSIVKGFDAYLASVNPATAIDSANKDSWKRSSASVLATFNSLTAEQKRIAALFYQANQDLFKSFETKVTKNLNASINFREITDCSKTTPEDFYECAAEVLTDVCDELKCSLDAALTTVEGEDYQIPVFSAVYMQFFKKEAFELKRALEIFLSKKWILNENLFDNIQTVYPDEQFVDLNVQASLRSLHPDKDRGIRIAIDNFIHGLAALEYKWSKLTSLPPFPQYQTGETDIEPIRLTATQIKIEMSPSYPRVSLWGWDGREIKFNSTTDQEETFTYSIGTDVKGYFKNAGKVVSGKVTALTDLLPYYKSAIVGDWIIETHNNINSQGWDLVQKQFITIDPTFKIYLNSYQDYGPPGSQDPPPYAYTLPHLKGTGSIIRNGNQYYFRDEGGKVSQPLSYPLSSFWLGNPPTTGSGGIKYVR